MPHCVLLSFYPDYFFFCLGGWGGQAKFWLYLFQPWASHFLGRHSTTWATIPATTNQISETGSHYVARLAGKPRPSCLCIPQGRDYRCAPTYSDSTLSFDPTNPAYHSAWSTATVYWLLSLLYPKHLTYPPAHWHCSASQEQDFQNKRYEENFVCVCVVLGMEPSPC
jgi:hypothetical protein